MGMGIWFVVCFLLLSLLLTGCGQPETGESEKGGTPEGKIEQPAFTELPSEVTSDSDVTPEPDEAKPASPRGEYPNLNDDEVLEQLLAEAIPLTPSQMSQGIGPNPFTHNGEPYSGWAKGLYDNGHVRSLHHFRDGELDGPSIKWHENGQKSHESAFKDGKVEGLAIRWHENGQKAAEVAHKDGFPEGTSTYWYQSGQKSAEVTVKDGREVATKQWDRQGNPVDMDGNPVE